MVTKQRNSKVFLIAVIMLSMFSIAFANAKSLYVIDDINGYPLIPVSAYDIGASGLLTWQATYSVPNIAGGAVGIALDSDSSALFITYEFINTIQLINATTMTDIGTTTAPGAANLAGIVYDHGKKKVYTVDRHTQNLYSYSWNAVTQALTLDSGFPKALAVSQFFGLSLDEGNDLLYVADASTTIKYFDTASWALAGSITVSHYATDVAIDETRGFVYSGHWASAPGGSSNKLIKYDLNTNTETSVALSTLPGITSTSEEVFGVAVDSKTGKVYTTTGYSYDRLLVFDSNLNPLQDLGDIGNPTGLVVPLEETSYNPLNLGKSDGLLPSESVNPGKTITYTITYDNTLNPSPVNNVVIIDTLSPDTTFESATNGGTYNPVTHTVTWNIGTLAGGAPSASVTLVVRVKIGTPPDTIIHNSATIDSDDTPRTTVNEYTKVTIPFVIPEIPLGTLMGLASMIAALVLITKRPALPIRT